MRRQLGVAVIGAGLAGCTAIFGFDKSVDSADGPLGPEDPSRIDGGAGTFDGAVDAPDGSTPETAPVEPYVDPTFGGGATGKIIVPGTTAPIGGVTTCSVAVSADQRVGFSCSTGGTRVYRMNADGTRDMALPGTADDGYTFAAIFPQEAKLVGAGARVPTTQNVLARYGDTGLDTSFGTNGLLHASISDYSFFSGGVRSGTSVQLWGGTYPAGASVNDEFTVAFDLATSTFGPVASTSGVVPSDKHFVIAGVAVIDASTVEVFGLYGPSVQVAADSYGFVRWRNGAPDTSFGSGGFLTYPVSGQTAANGGAVVSGGIVMATSRYSTESTVLARFSFDGAPDTTFGAAGFVALDPRAGAPAGTSGYLVHQILPLPGGRFLVGGTALAGVARSRAFLARFDAKGVLDTTFAESGFAYPKVRISPTFEEIYALDIQTDGSVVAVGTTQAQSGSYDMFAMRLKP